MPILEGFNPFSWNDRVQHILNKEEKNIRFELETVLPQFAVIRLLTDQEGKVHVYLNNRQAVIGGIETWKVDELRKYIEQVDLVARRKGYKYVKIEAFLPFWFLKRLYLPDYWKPYKKSRKKRII